VKEEESIESLKEIGEIIEIETVYPLISVIPSTSLKITESPS
jgi:hypothetical protein